MPTYEYLCQACGSRFEAWQKITDDPIEICPTCGDHVHRVLYPVGLVFKGSGFYKTDNRGNAGNAGNASSTGGSNGATESKPADTKSGEAKPAETKPAETKSAAAGE